MRRILAYEKNGQCAVKDFFEKVNPKIQSKFKYQLDYMRDEHNPLAEPIIEHFSIKKYKQLYQMRIKKAETIVRVIFFKKDNEIILLHAFYKQDNKDTKKALEISLKLLQSLEENNGSENIVCREMI